MSRYDYKCKTCEIEYELEQHMSEDKFAEHECPKCGNKQPCERLISGGTATHFIGTDFQTNLKGRGYKGKFGNKIRPTGTPVDAPASKEESDMQFQKWVDTGGLDGIKPTMDLGKAAPQTAEQQIDKKWQPRD